MTPTVERTLHNLAESFVDSASIMTSGSAPIGAGNALRSAVLARKLLEPVGVQDATRDIALSPRQEDFLREVISAQCGAELWQVRRYLDSLGRRGAESRSGDISLSYSASSYFSGGYFENNLLPLLAEGRACDPKLLERIASDVRELGNHVASLPLTRMLLATGINLFSRFRGE